MGALSTVLLVLGILMFIEGCTFIFFPNFGLKMFRRFFKSAEKNINIWVIGEIIVGIILIVIGTRL